MNSQSCKEEKMNLRPLLLSSFLATAQAQGQDVDCTRLGPNREITIDFMMQFHDKPDAFTNGIQKMYPNSSLRGVMLLFNHLLAHGVPKERMTRAIQACDVSNVNINTPGH